MATDQDLLHAVRAYRNAVAYPAIHIPILQAARNLATLARQLSNPAIRLLAEQFLSWDSDMGGDLRQLADQLADAIEDYLAIEV